MPTREVVSVQNEWHVQVERGADESQRREERAKLAARRTLRRRVLRVVALWAVSLVWAAWGRGECQWWVAVGRA